MTTMDSDSESQDSDEGRRFRFEATRKDATASLHSRKRKLPPSRTNSRHRSQSRERDHRDRRDADKPRREHNKESQRSSDINSSSKDHDIKHFKDNDATRSSSRYRNGRDSKYPSNHKKLNDCRESSSAKSRKESRLCEHDKRRSHEHSTDRNHDEKISEKHTKIFRDRNKSGQSRERSREQSHQVCSTKMLHVGRSCDDGNKIESSGKVLRNYDNKRNVADEGKNVEKGNIVSKTNPNSQSSSPSSKQECKDLNLSDFDIVSDTEENSSDNSGSRQGSNKSMHKRVEKVLPYEHGSNIKKRISKHQYERLLKRQVVKKGSNLEELHKVEVKNGNQLRGKSNHNRSAVPNFSLGASATISTVPHLSTNNMCRKEISTSDHTDMQSMKTGLDNSNCSTHDSALRPKTADPRYVRCDEINKTEGGKEEISPLKENGTMPIAPRIIGPTLPAHLRQPIEDTAMEMEDTFGPVLPPHLALQNVVDENSEEQTTFPICPGYDTNKSESMERILHPGSEAEDDGIIGPLPSDHPALEDDLVQQQLESRARRLKVELAMCDIEDEKKREEWMIELPPAQSVNLGLGPRKFRVRPAPDLSDRSSWTDTPADRARKQMEKLEGKNMVPEATICVGRDASNNPTEPDTSKKRPKSLLKIHQKHLQKKKKKDEKEAKKIGKTIERRPFDRDVDLQANHFDEARKKSMFLKARELDDRFSRGKL